MQRAEKYELARFGQFRTDRMRYAPLDVARITFECRNAPREAYLFEVWDGAGKPYFSHEVPAPGGIAQFTVQVGGEPGLHTLRACLDGKSSLYPFRMGSLILEPVTDARAEGTDLQEFFRWLREGLAASLDPARYAGKRILGDKYADNSTMNIAYPRFRMDTTVYLEEAETLKGTLDLAFKHQKPDGSLYDHIYGDNHPGWEGQRMIRSMMADMETGAIINVHQVWMATGDNDWMRGLMEPMLRGWKYATSAPLLWDAKHQLVKRPHTADEWDVQTGDGNCFHNQNSRYVLACCDAVRLPKAADALAAMLSALGREQEAAKFSDFALQARRRANALLWDGVKYRHHLHLDAIEHPGFNEADQLAMSNTWACTDGLASHEQAVGIIEEYERRLKLTGDRYPWWTLQPGYPDGYFPSYPTGVYVNGGLFPWVGGELCRACFMHGFEERGWRQFREFWEQVKADGGACVTWLTLDGHAAANTSWTTNHDPWSIGAWGRTAIEAVVGVTPLAPAMERCRCALRWPAGGIRKASACVAMPASHSYFAYQYETDGKGIRLNFTGTGKEVVFALPQRQFPALGKALLNGATAPVTVEEVSNVPCFCVRAPVDRVSEVVLLNE